MISDRLFTHITFLLSYARKQELYDNKALLVFPEKKVTGDPSGR